MPTSCSLLVCHFCVLALFLCCSLVGERGARLCKRKGGATSGDVYRAAAAALAARVGSLRSFSSTYRYLFLHICCCSCSALVTDRVGSGGRALCCPGLADSYCTSTAPAACYCGPALPDPWFVLSPSISVGCFHPLSHFSRKPAAQLMCV